ncbi:MAG: hypothetical protein AAF098_12120 [Pseudomonadota bacterium]
MQIEKSVALLLTIFLTGCSVDFDETVSLYLPYWPSCETASKELESTLADRKGFAGMRLLEVYSMAPKGAPINSLLEVRVESTKRSTIEPILNFYRVSCAPQASLTVSFDGFNERLITEQVRRLPTGPYKEGPYLVSVDGNEARVFLYKGVPQ